MKSSTAKFMPLIAALVLAAAVLCLPTFAQTGEPVHNIVWSPANASMATGMGQLYVNNYVRGIDAVIDNGSLKGDSLSFDVKQLAFTDSSDMATVYDLSGNPYRGDYLLDQSSVRVAMDDVRKANITTGPVENVTLEQGNGTYVHMDAIMQGQDPAAASFQVSGMNLVFPDGRAISYAFTNPINAVYDKNGRLIMMNVPPSFGAETREAMAKGPSDKGGPVPIAMLRERAAAGEKKVVA
jgi:hypothetical protein